MKKRKYALLMAAAMAATSLAGCGGSGGSQTAETTKAPETTAAGETAGTVETSAEFTYPMAAGDKLQYWCDLTTTVSVIPHLDRAGRRTPEWRLNSYIHRQASRKSSSA